MKMVSAGAGLGVGVKDYRVIFVFETDRRCRHSSTPAGRVQGRPTRRPRQARAARLTRGPSRWRRASGCIEITKNGLALQLTLQGTKYYKNDDLNKK